MYTFARVALTGPREAHTEYPPTGRHLLLTIHVLEVPCPYLSINAGRQAGRQAGRKIRK